MLVRALIYRITTDYAANRNAYQTVIDLALTYTS
jgi:hypothetical protein